MKKKLFGVVALAALAAGALASCGEEKDTFNIYVWNEEFKGFFKKYVSDEKKADADTYHLDGVEVKWTTVPSDGGKYQSALDTALKGNKKAKNSKKVDMFLAEADYIQKYANSEYTQDIKALGVTDFSNTYKYTVQAASDSNNVVKGVSFQCCPSALIYNRVVAKELFGTDDPAEVQKHVSDWTKFDETAALAKSKGKYMTACEADTYRVFSNNASKPWVDGENIQIPDTVQTWMNQAEKYIKEGYTIAADVWSPDKVKNIKENSNAAFCTFGPAWYYNFCMGDSKKGDWAICEGPMAHFWGGTWIMAPTGSHHPELVEKVMNAFINDEDVCTNLIKKEGQFTNNQNVNQKVAEDKTYGNEFLAGQNDTAIFVELAKNIKFENTTVYDQLCNEGLQEKFREYLKGTVSKDKAITNFYSYITEKYPSLKAPK